MALKYSLGADEFPHVVYISHEHFEANPTWYREFNVWAETDEPSGYWGFTRHHVRHRTIGYWFRFDDEQTAFLFKMRFG